MLGLNSIRAKLILSMMVVASLALCTAAFGLHTIDQLSQTAETVVERYVPYSRCCEQALLTVAANSLCLDRLRLLNAGSKEAAFADLEREVRENSNRFDMFMKAMIWGSNSEPFSRSAGGLLLSRWQAEGWEKKMKVVQAPESIRRAAGTASLYYGAFAKYAAKVIDDQRRLLRLKQKGGPQKELEQLKRQLEFDYQKAERFAGLTNDTLEQTVSAIHVQLRAAMNHVRAMRETARHALAAFAFSAFVVSVVLGMMFATHSIVRPLQRLREGVHIAARGDLDHKIPVTGYDELAELSEAFNRMTASLKEITASRDELERAKNAAEAASRAKTAFLANMSHEIRTPLHAVLGMAELLQETQLDVEQREYLQAIQHSGESLLKLINDVLDLSKIEAGKFALEEDPFELDELVGNLLKSFSPAAHRKGLELAYYVSPKLPRWVVGDGRRLEQILNNLVDNAIKFTESGEVRIEVQRGSVEPTAVEVEFSVADTGPGIPPEQLEKIFDKFEQGDPSTRRRHGGAGLGLAIASALVEMMGGRLTVESKVGHGSVFRFTLKLKRGSEAEMVLPAVHLPETGTALVAHHHPLTRAFLGDVLQSWHFETCTAADSDELATWVKEVEGTERKVALVLLDEQVAQQNEQLVKRLKQRLVSWGKLVLLLSSPEPRAESTVAPAILAQCDGSLRLPAKISELRELVNSLTATEAASRDSAASASVNTEDRPLRVLLADDSLVNRKLAIALLEKHGFEVTAVGSGKEAVEAVRTSDFDVILMDVQMPEMDGYEATAAIREFEAVQGRKTPIIAMTAHALKGDRERCLAAGMDGYVAKPVRSEELLAEIEIAVRTGGQQPSSSSE